MRTSKLLGCLLVGFLVLGTGIVAAQGADAPKKHIVIFIADDHGQDTGAYGNPIIQTPNLDALAEEGTRFTYAFATTASCSASRSVILTGLHNHRNGQYGHAHSYHHFKSYDYLKSLPALLRDVGYRTASAGKYHVAPESAYPFDHFFRGEIRNSVAMTEQVRDFVSAEDERPFFLYFATYDPHRGGKTQKTFGEDFAGPVNGFGNRNDGFTGIEPITYDPDEVLVPEWLPDNAATRAELAEYYQSVSRLDQGFGALMNLLKEAGIYEQTLIIYMSDHGIAMPGAKTTVYEPGLRSPLIVRHPEARQRGIVSDAMISWVDITPTLLAYAGAEEPTYPQHVVNYEVAHYAMLPEEHGLHGRSFLSIIDEPRPNGWNEVYASHTFHEIHMYYPMRVVRDRQYKLIWNIAHGLPYPFASDLWVSATWQEVYQQGPDAMYGVRTVQDYIHRPAFELYDIAADPNEAHNLAADPAYAEVLATYQAKLRIFQERTSDPWVFKWHYE